MQSVKNTFNRFNIEIWTNLLENKGYPQYYLLVWYKDIIQLRKIRFQNIILCWCL